MKIKDLIIIAVITIVCFPLVLGFVMFISGFMNVSFGWKKAAVENDSKIETVKYSAYEDSLATLHSKSFKALEMQRSELTERRKQVEEEEHRLDNLKLDISRRTEDLEKTKARLESMVKQSSELEERRIKQLAGIYGSMRPEEAAPILFTLNNDLIVRILRRIDEDRQKAKIMAAMGRISQERAGKISKLLTDTKVN
ncbi:MAG: hypothetical protein A2293_03365 [Elusimicrobia bacterium RIFOXYB2_FULL_49_7]|nr:MAG: hypothetical protein A2293_03365 [Elusimicrobia bacterium RIFOXYB2_FULL_49_7]